MSSIHLLALYHRAYRAHYSGICGIIGLLIPNVIIPASQHECDVRAKWPLCAFGPRGDFSVHCAWLFFLFLTVRLSVVCIKRHLSNSLSGFQTSTTQGGTHTAPLHIVLLLGEESEADLVIFSYFFGSMFVSL